MKVAILSDIHGNLDALNAVLHSVDSKGIEILLVAGDSVGYYYESRQVIKRLSTYHCIAIQGNHERLLLDVHKGINTETIRKKYGSSYEMALKEFTTKELRNLELLPQKVLVEINGKKIIICHGSPWEADQYIYPSDYEKVKDKIFREQADLLIFGHTHYPLLWAQGDQQVVNPGSVGQARDKIAGASWAEYDTVSGTIIFHREKYDLCRIIEQCKEHDPEIHYLTEVLTRGDR